MSATPAALYREIASLIEARQNCRKANNTEWFDKHEETILSLVKDFMPSGSGIDSGTEIDLDRSKPDKLVFTFGYHHMNENGYYDGWTHHTLIVRPSLAHGIDITISGRDRNQIKDYLHETYRHALVSLVWQERDSLTWRSSIYGHPLPEFAHE